MSWSVVILYSAHISATILYSAHYASRQGDVNAQSTPHVEVHASAQWESSQTHPALHDVRRWSSWHVLPSDFKASTWACADAAISGLLVCRQEKPLTSLLSNIITCWEILKGMAKIWHLNMTSERETGLLKTLVSRHSSLVTKGLYYFDYIILMYLWRRKS